MPAGTVLGWSGWRPTDAQLRQMLALGIVGCHRYETDDDPGNQWKVCSKAEYDNLLSLGFHVLSDFEVHGTSWRGGYPLGVKHGEMGRRKWRAKGLPDERPISFAIDSAVPVAERETALEYLRGCRDGGGVGPVMGYGGSPVIDEAVKRGYTKNSHRTAAESWSDFQPSTTATLKQVVQASYAQWFPPDAQGRHPYDENIIVDPINKPDWGQHPKPQGDDMPNNAPYALMKDETGKIWQVDASQQSKVLVPDTDVLGWVQALIIWGGYPAGQEKVGEVGTNATLRRWLANIPVSPGPPPPPPPAVVDNAAIAKAVLDGMSARLTG